MKKRKVRTTIVVDRDVLDKLRQVKKITGITIGEVAGQAIALHWGGIVQEHMDEVERQKLSELDQHRRALKLKLGQVEREIERCKDKVR